MIISTEHEHIGDYEYSIYIDDVYIDFGCECYQNKNNLIDSNGDKNLRILILKSEGKHFCAGADINMMREAGSKTL